MSQLLYRLDEAAREYAKSIESGEFPQIQPLWEARQKLYLDAAKEIRTQAEEIERLRAEIKLLQYIQQIRVLDQAGGE